MRRIITFVASHKMVYEMEIDTTPLVMSWEWKSVASGAVTLKGVTDVTVTITSNPGTFFNTSTDNITYGISAISENGNFTLYVKAQADNDVTPNSGSVTISDDDGNADDLVIPISQIAKPD